MPEIAKTLSLVRNRYPAQNSPGPSPLSATRCTCPELPPPPETLLPKPQMAYHHPAIKITLLLETERQRATSFSDFTTHTSIYSGGSHLLVAHLLLSDPLPLKALLPKFWIIYHQAVVGLLLLPGTERQGATSLSNLMTLTMI